jgi:hypothetical protein
MGRGLSGAVTRSGSLRSRVELSDWFGDDPNGAYTYPGSIPAPAVGAIGAARFKRVGGVEGQSLKIGRMEFIDGAEVSPKSTTLAALKRDRIAHRLLGNFGFSHVGRSVDGILYALDRPTLNVTMLGARPTQGVFQDDGLYGGGPQQNRALRDGSLSPHRAHHAPCEAGSLA